MDCYVNFEILPKGLFLNAMGVGCSGGNVDETTVNSCVSATTMSGNPSGGNRLQAD